MLSSEVQKANAPFPMDCIELDSANTTVFKEKQFWNAPSPISSTDEGIVTLVRST